MIIDQELFTKIKKAFEGANFGVDRCDGHGVGKEGCLGCVGDSPIDIIIDVIQALLENSSEIDNQLIEAIKTLRCVRTINAGRDKIVYWPNITWFDIEESTPANEEDPVGVDVNTNEYELAHGKLPHGEGNWAFYFGSDRDDPQFFSGMYRDARKQAARIAFSEGFESITVGS